MPNREIGVGKVLGANVSRIVKLPIRDFVKLVMIAILTATPVARLAMYKWLEDFVYCSTITLLVFIEQEEWL